MALFASDVLVVEQPWTARSLLWRTRYEAEVYDGRDVLIAVVSERSGPGALALARATGLSGRTSFDLRVTEPHGRDLLAIRKGMGKPPTDVSTPDGAPVGSVRHEGRRRGIALLDPARQHLAMLGDVATLQVKALAKRNGKRIRRDVLRLRPGAPEPLRSLAITAALAYDVVTGVGTAHATGGPLDFPA